MGGVGPNKNEQYVAIITIQKKYAIKLLLLTNLLQRNKDFSSFIPQNLDDIRIFPPSSLTVQRQQVATITYSVMHRFIQRHRFLPINFNIHAWHTPLTWLMKYLHETLLVSRWCCQSACWSILHFTSTVTPRSLLLC